MLQQLVSAETPNKDPRRGLSAAADSRDKRARGRVSQKLIHLSQRCWKKPDVWCNCKSLGVVGSTLEGLDYAKKCPSKPVLGKMRKAEAAAWSTTAFQAAAPALRIFWKPRESPLRRHGHVLRLQAHSPKLRWHRPQPNTHSDAGNVLLALVARHVFRCRAAPWTLSVQDVRFSACRRVRLMMKRLN